MSVSNDRDRLDVEALRFLATVRLLERATGGLADALQGFWQAIDAAGDSERAIRAALWAWWGDVPAADRNAVMAALKRIFGAGGAA